MNFSVAYSRYQSAFESALSDYCATMKQEPSVLRESMRYSLTLGGKRVRPVLLLSTAELLKVKKEDVYPFALAIEMIHTYSLIHDDLPAMDNDDFRRGKPSNHKVFGEGNAILAGDALLNDALTIAISESRKGISHAEAALFLSECSGSMGMIAGQSADLLHEKSDSHTEADLEFIDSHKTGKMLLAPVVIPAILAGVEKQPFLSFGEHLGKLFQWTDDILDVEGDFSRLGKTIGKDEKEGKLTLVTLFGLDEAKRRTDLMKEQCLKDLAFLPGDTSFLREMVEYVRARKH